MQTTFRSNSETMSVVRDLARIVSEVVVFATGVVALVALVIAGFCIVCAIIAALPCFLFTVLGVGLSLSMKLAALVGVIGTLVVSFWYADRCS